MFGIRDVKKDDLPHLYDCDLKCFDYVWSEEEWEFALKNYGVKIIHLYGTPIGFVAYAPGDKQMVLLVKLGIKPNFRKRGAGRIGFIEARKFAEQMGARGIECIVPETLCDPQNPQNLLGWLKKTGMSGTGVVKDYLPHEDGFSFELLLESSCRE